MKARALVVAAVLGLPACSSNLERMPADAHVVAAPISDRANLVLANLVAEYGSSSGHWQRSMGPGCSAIWATQFGLCAGVRRGRDDVSAIGRTTAARVSAETIDLFVKAVFGRLDLEDPTLPSFPALFVSGSVDGKAIDASLFSAGLARIDTLLDDPRLRAPERAGLAVVLATISGLEPGARERRLEQARKLAASVTQPAEATLHFFALAAVARASRGADDLQLALDALASTPYRSADESVRAEAADRGVLSRDLAMIHGLADLAQATGDARYRTDAVTLLDEVFGDRYFDGRFLCHDRIGGERSDQVCSGCNFMALYLVDRLWGDSFVIAPVAPLSHRDQEWELAALPKRRPRRPDLSRDPGGQTWRFTLASEPGGTPGIRVETIDPLAPAGSFVFVHEPTGKDILLRYQLLDAEALPPDGGVYICQPIGDVTLLPGLSVRDAHLTMDVPFDPEGKASLRRGDEPLICSVTFFQNPGRAASAVIRLTEARPKE